MQNINGTNYLSVKEYAEMKGLTAGRIYQLKNELPFEKFEDLGVDLINFDLLSLSEKEISLAHTKFQTTHALHTYDYKQLGLFVADTLKSSNDARASAEVILKEKDILVEQKNTAIDALQLKNEELSRDLATLRQENEALNQSFTAKSQDFESLTQVFEEQKIKVIELSADKEKSIKEIADFKAIQQKMQSDYDLKVLENQTLSNDIQSYKGQVVSLGKEIEKLSTEVSSLKTDYQIVVQQKEELGKELVQSQSIQQKTAFDYDLKVLEIKSLEKENALIKQQMEVLSANIEADKGFNDRLDQLEKLLVAPKVSKPKTERHPKPLS